MSTYYFPAFETFFALNLGGLAVAFRTGTYGNPTGKMVTNNLI